MSSYGAFTSVLVFLDFVLVSVLKYKNGKQNPEVCKTLKVCSPVDKTVPSSVLRTQSTEDHCETSSQQRNSKMKTVVPSTIILRETEQLEHLMKDFRNGKPWTVGWPKGTK